MGTRHARVLSALQDRFEVVRGYDVDRAASVPAGLSRSRSEAEAFAGADAAIVATPILTHAPIVSRVLAAGVDVLVEKPLCATSAESRALLEAQRRGGARLYVGHSERFNPVVRALAKLLRGRSDRVLAIESKRVGPSRPSECGVLLNLGVHDFDLAAYLGGGPLELRGAVGGADFAQVVFETAEGAAGHLCVDRTAPERRRSIVVTTSRWVYEGDLLHHRLVRIARGSGARLDVPLPLEEPLLAQVRALADALDGTGSRELATGEDGAAAVALAERSAGVLAEPAEDLSLLARA
jgi:UDP-N-acetylglucosamine 3-dehydrogenase